MTTVVADLAELIAFPTVSSRPVTAIAAWMSERCEALGFRIERFDDPEDAGKTNIVATIGPDRPGGLVLSGHMDVVPVAGQPWSSDPFVLAERDGRLYGRGTADMKGFLAATVRALSGIDRGDYQRPLVLVWTHDEEIGCHGSAHLAQTLLDDNRVLPQACLIGEPTDFRILRMHAGHVGVEVTLSGQAAHSAFPELGANTIEAAAMVVETVRSLAATLRAERHEVEGLDRPWVPVNIARIEGGSALNIVPDHCVVQIGFRPLPGMGHEPIVERMVDAIERLSLPAGTRGAVNVLRVTPSLLTPEGTDLESLLRPHADDPRTGSAAFATDGGNLARVGSLPLVFGPGSIEVAHQADEYIDGVALHRSVGVIAEIVRARCC